VSLILIKIIRRDAGSKKDPIALTVNSKPSPKQLINYKIYPNDDRDDICNYILVHIDHCFPLIHLYLSMALN
jgi:hypothetical protein